MAKPDNQCPIESGIACLAQWDLIRATDGTEAELVRKVLQAAFRAGRVEMRERAAKVAAPYHTTSGNDENGCPVLCSACGDRRRIRDRIRALPIDGVSETAEDVVREMNAAEDLDDVRRQ